MIRVFVVDERALSGGGSGYGCWLITLARSRGESRKKTGEAGNDFTR